MNFGDVFMAFFMGMPLDKEEFDKFFDESFIKYFQDTPNGYDEVMRLIEEKAPADSKEMIIEKMDKIYEQSKKGGEDGRD